MKRIATTLAVALALLAFKGAQAATITFTGSETDFTGAGVTPIQDDGIDTQAFDCGFGPVDHPLDIGKVYITNDASKVYIGFQYQHFCFCDINLFVAMNVKAGGTTADPFGRQIDWSAIANPPDYYVYDVIPTVCNGYNYEVLYQANGGGGWNTVMDGSNGLGIEDADGGNFVEIALPLSSLEIGCGPNDHQVLDFELGVTQEGSTKPAFDLVANDDQQRSDVNGTCFDVGAQCGPSVPTRYLSYALDCPTPAEGKSWGSIKSQYR